MTNICHNAVDRWADDPATCNRVAFYCEPNHPDTPATLVTYGELRNMVARFAVVLRDLGVQKGDPVVLYMPMVVELPAAMLACARIGAVHSVVFGGFSADALAGRILDSKARVVVSAHSVGRGLKTIPLKQIMDTAIDIVAAARAPASLSKDNGGDEFFKVRHHVVVRADHSQPPQDLQLPSNGGIDIDWDDACNAVSDTMAAESPVEWVPAEHPLFILYTSGSTGKPKGVVHSTAGYMTYAATTFKYVFDFDAAHGDVFFSTSDCGWITGHTYVTYGPLLNGASQVLYEGVPTFPDAGRLWAVCEKYGVTQLYTAPTVIRALKGAAPPTSSPPASDGGKDVSSTPSSDQWVTSHDLSKLRILGTVGEPINPEAWIWYFDVIGGGNCAIVDTWWQTETGGHCLTPLPIPGLELKPGSAMLPFFGVEPALLDASGAELQTSGHGDDHTQGYLVLKRPWPSTLRSVYGDHARMEQTYFARFPGFYMTGDGARRDSDGHYWLTGRVDDLLNVSGHRIGTAEVEAAIVMHAKVAESAVVAVDHPVKGESIYAYVTLLPQHTGALSSEMDEAEKKRKSELKKEIVQVVRKQIGPFAKPDVIHWAPALPKTRSGKIMRRILRKIAADGKKTDRGALGDTSTLTDPSVVDALLATHGL